MNTVLNIDLLWERIYHYVDYPNLSRSEKVELDKIYAELFKSLSFSLERNKYLNITHGTNIFDYDSMPTSEFRENLGNWLIDNRLNLVFSNIFGHHVGLRSELLELHAFKDKDITKHNAFNGLDRDKLADLYTGMHYGIFLSGMNNTPVDVCPIIIGSRYFLLNKDIDQNRLTYDFELNVAPYERKDAIEDYKEMIKSLDQTPSFKLD